MGLYDSKQKAIVERKTAPYTQTQMLMSGTRAKSCSRRPTGIPTVYTWMIMSQPELAYFASSEQGERHYHFVWGMTYGAAFST